MARMRILALLVWAGAACATATPSRTEVEVPNRPPPAQPIPAARSTPALADEIIKAQTETSGDVTAAFSPVSADLHSGDDRRVAAALEVVEAIGTRIDEMARKCPNGDFDGLLCGMSNLDTLANHIADTLVWLGRKGGCATVAGVDRATKQFDRLPRFHRPPQATLNTLVLQSPPDNALPIRAFVCGMNAVKGKVAACFAEYEIPGTVMLNVSIGRNGAVSSAVATGQFADTPTGACVESAARTATFPPSDGFSSGFPFVLKPTSPGPASR
jgi:hypothetical protein